MKNQEDKPIPYADALLQLRMAAPRIHCLNNPVSMTGVANLLLAVGASAIMAQDAAEVSEITGSCHATLINTGVPSMEKFHSSLLAGMRANELGHPVIFDPVGVGASRFRKENIARLLRFVRPALIRCNLEEAIALLHLYAASHAKAPSALVHALCPDASGMQGGVESGISADPRTLLLAARELAGLSHACVLISGPADAISDGVRCFLVRGGDWRIAKITGSGCMLSALCAAFSASDLPAWQAACAAAQAWKQAACQAGRKVDDFPKDASLPAAGIGSFYMFLLDSVQMMASAAKQPSLQATNSDNQKGDVVIEDFTGKTPPLCDI